MVKVYCHFKAQFILEVNLLQTDLVTLIALDPNTQKPLQQQRKHMALKLPSQALTHHQGWSPPGKARLFLP